MKKLYFFSFMVFFQLHVFAQPVASIDSFMQYCQTNFRFNGVVLLADSNNIIYHHAFGKESWDSKENMKPGTKFRLGSLSKQFTAFVVLQLIEKGSLSFNDPLAKFIKAFNQPGKRDITIRNLLTHTSGLTDYTNLETFNDQLYYKKDSIIKMIASAPLLFPPSSAYSYCNSNFYLLALIVEKLTGKDFASVLNEMIFKKAGMQNSGEEEGSVKTEANAYVYRNDSTVAAPFIEMKNTKGGGEMYSTSGDLLKWSLFLQRQLAKNTLLRNAFQPVTLPNGTISIYSCGWCLMPDVIFHTGHINGFANLISIDTTHHQTIILLTNDDYRQLYITMQTLKDILQQKETRSNWLANKPFNNLADYRGLYSFGNFKLNIKDSSTYLEVEVSGQKHFLRSYSNDEFFALDLDGIIKFERDSGGNVIALKSFQNYSWVTFKKE
jgi:CubicO group peptidase (beta-lactamase class C family)